MKTLNLFIITLAIIMGIFACTFTPEKKILPKQAPTASGQVGEKRISEVSTTQQLSDSIVREKRLISNNARCVAADTNNVWIATDKGASRFLRGKNVWRHYTKADGLADDDINAVAIDGNYIWFATNAGVSRYDVTKDKFRNFKRKDGLVSDKVACIAVDGNYVWFGTDQGLSRYDKTIDSWATRTKKDGLVSNDIRTIAVEDEYVWVGMVKEVEKAQDMRFRTREEMKPKTGGVSRYHRTTDSWNNYTKADGLIDDELSVIAVDEEFVWFGTQNAGVSVYSKTDQTFVKTYTNTDLLVSNKISSIVADGNQVWFGTRNGGVQRYVRSVDTWMRYTHKPPRSDGILVGKASVNEANTDDGLAGNHITWIAASGNEVWFSTEQSGVSRFNKVTGKWTIYSKADWLADNDVRCIEPLVVYESLSEGSEVERSEPQSVPDGVQPRRHRVGEQYKLWIGTADGLSLYDINSQEWTTYGKNDGLTTNYITAVKAIDDEIWVGTPRGLARLLNTGEWKFYCQKDGLKDEFVTAIAKSVSENAIWVGTSNGLYRFDLVKNQWESFVNKDGLPADMASRGEIASFASCLATAPATFGFVNRFTSFTDDFVLRVTAIAFFGARIWVGTSNGLFAYDPQKQKTTLYLTDRGLGDNYVNTIEPAQNALWVGTRGGLSRYDSVSDAFFNYTEQDGPALERSEGLPNLNVKALCMDDARNTLWIGTPKGLAAFLFSGEIKVAWTPSETEGQFKNLSDVVNENIKCIRLCSLRSPTPSAYGQGKLWLGTTTGMLEFQPDTYAKMTYRSQATVEPLLESNIENVELDGDYIWFSNWAASKNGGIIRYNKSTGTWQKYTRMDILHSTKTQSMTNVRRIYVDDSDVWFATDYGALRYEKASDTWMHYTTADGLSSNELRHIAVSTNSVWMSDAGGGGVSRYDKKTGKWTSLSLESKFPFESINCIATDLPAPQATRQAGGDDVWFAMGTGVYQFNGATGKFRKYTQKDGLAGDGAEWICVDGDDVWIARSRWGEETPKALSRYNKATGKWKIYSSTDVLSERYLAKIVRGAKYVWFLYHPFADAGITRYDKRTDEWTTIKPKGDWGGGVTELAEDGDYIWLATLRNGVHRYHFASGTWISYDDKNGLMHNHINDRALKVDGNYVWVGTPRGLSRYDKRDESWTILTEAKTMVGKEVRAIATDSRYVWCGTPVGLSRYDKEYGTWMTFRKRGGMQELRVGYSTWRWFEPESAEGLINSWVTYLSVDNQYVWIGTRGGANRYDKIADVWDRYTPENGLPSEDITAVASDGNNVWMGTNAGLGRFPRTSDDKNAWVSYTSGIDIKPGALSKEYAETLVSNEVWCLATDKKYVWVGAKLGVSRYDKRKDMWKTFTTENGLASNKVNCIAIQGNYVWFGSDLGVSVYDQKKGDWIHFTQKDGLASNRITSIAIDGKDVWIGTLDSGVSRYNIEEKTWRSYKKADGLAHNGIFAISCDVDGENVWFGTHRGLSRYNKHTDTWTIYTEHYDSEDI